MAAERSKSCVRQIPFLSFPSTLSLHPFPLPLEVGPVLFIPARESGGSSAVSSPSGVWSGAEVEFGAF